MKSKLGATNRVFFYVAVVDNVLQEFVIDSYSEPTLKSIAHDTGLIGRWLQHWNEHGATIYRSQELSHDPHLSGQGYPGRDSIQDGTGSDRCPAGDKLNTVFEYGEIKDGSLVILPGLRNNFEMEWPEHQRQIDRILTHHKLPGYRVRLMPNFNLDPRRTGGGNVAYSLKLIVLIYHSRYEMLATLYHEIIHIEHRDWSEEQVEAETQRVFPKKISVEA